MHDNIFHHAHKLRPIFCHLMSTYCDPFVKLARYCKFGKLLSISSSLLRKRVQDVRSTRMTIMHVQHVAVVYWVQYVIPVLNISCTCTLSRETASCASKYIVNNTSALLDEGNALHSTRCKVGKAVQKTSQLNSFSLMIPCSWATKGHCNTYSTAYGCTTWSTTTISCWR